MNTKHINIRNPSLREKTIPQIHCLAIDTTVSSGYFWRGSQRNSDAGLQVFQYTLKGCGAFSVRDKVHSVPEGTGFLCNLFDPDITYFYPQQEKHPWSFLYIVFSGMENWAKELNADFGYLFRFAAKNSFISQILQICTHSEPTLPLASSTQIQLISTLFVELFRIGENEGCQTQHGNLIGKAIEIMNDRMESRISTWDIAKHLGISTEHLCRLFQTHMHVSPLVYFQKQQIQHICALLMKQGMTIKEIATRLQIDNVSNFTRFFKHYVGMTPAQFRNHGGIIVSEKGTVFRQHK
jgi:AraC-like DNA-binding protein